MFGARSLLDALPWHHHEVQGGLGNLRLEPSPLQDSARLVGVGAGSSKAALCPQRHLQEELRAYLDHAAGAGQRPAGRSSLKGRVLQFSGRKKGNGSFVTVTHAVQNVHILGNTGHCSEPESGGAHE